MRKIVSPLVLVTVLASVVAFYATYTHSSDLLPLWVAARFYAAGQYADIYADLSHGFAVRLPSWSGYIRPGNDYPSAYVQPPWLAAAMSGLATKMSFPSFSMLFLIANASSLFASIVISYNYFSSKSRYIWMVDKNVIFATLSLLVTSPFIALMYYNQTQCLVILSMLLVIVYGRKAPLLTGGFYGLAIAMKITPILLVAYLVWTRRVKSAGFAVLTAAAIALLDLALLQRSLNIEFLQGLSTIGSHIYIGKSNYMIYQFYYYIHNYDYYISVNNGPTDPLSAPAYLSPLLIMAGGASMTLTGMFARRAQDQRPYEALALIATVPFALIVWNHYFMIVLLVSFLLLDKPTYTKTATYIAIAVLIGIGLFLFGDTTGIQRVALANLGLLIAVIAMIGLAIHSRRREASPSNILQPISGQGFSTGSPAKLSGGGTV